MRISDIRDPNLFQRLVRKLMICEHGAEYQVVDDSGGDGGLDGFARTTGDLHAFYCPEKPSSARYRQKFKTDLEKAILLRDEKQYPIRRFVFVTPEPLREPDQRELRDLARRNGFDEGISIGADHLEVLFAKHDELLPQFPELSYPQLEKTLKRVADVVQQIQRTQESAIDRKESHTKSYKVTGVAAQILMLAVKSANKEIGGKIEADEIIQIFDLQKDQYKDAIEELDALDLIRGSKSANAPGGYQRIWIEAGAFVQVIPQVLAEINIRAELLSLLKAFGSNGGEYVTADEILQKSSVPPPRAQILIDFLTNKGLVETSMLGQTMLFYYGRILPVGKRILEGKDELLI